jgi:hypothetical protein
VLRRELLMPLALRKGLGRLDETAAAVGVLVEIHGAVSLSLSRAPFRHDRHIVIGCISRIGGFLMRINMISSVYCPSEPLSAIRRREIWGQFRPKKEPAPGRTAANLASRLPAGEGY